MNNILALYSSLYKSKQRFIDEVFESEVYKAATPQLTILDLGAYEGEFSFYCLNFAKKIYAEGAEKEIFEADDFPSIADKIKLIIGEIHISADGVRDNLKKNGFKVKDVGNGVVLATRK